MFQYAYWEIFGSGRLKYSGSPTMQRFTCTSISSYFSPRVLFLYSLFLTSRQKIQGLVSHQLTWSFVLVQIPFPLLLLPGRHTLTFPPLYTTDCYSDDHLDLQVCAQRTPASSIVARFTRCRPADGTKVVGRS